MLVPQNLYCELLIHNKYLGILIILPSSQVLSHVFLTVLNVQISFRKQLFQKCIRKDTELINKDMQ